MSTGGHCQRASGVKNQIMLSLCLIVVCLETVILSPRKQPVIQILLPFNLAAGHALAMASIFVPGNKMKSLAARLSVISASVSFIFVMIRELACEVQTCHYANAT